MKIKILAPIFALVISLLLLNACGSSSSTPASTESTPTITSLSDLPKATSPMESASANISKSLSIGKAGTATTGLNIISTKASSFSSASSIGACNTFNNVKQGIKSAAQADMIMCFVGAINDAAKFAGMTDADGNAIDIYDSQYHTFNMNITGDDGAPDKVKLKITKNAAGAITNFEMFMCKTGSQSEYTSQVIDGSGLTMHAIGRFSDGFGSGWHKVDVIGTLNADRVFTSKTITVQNNGTFNGNQNWAEGILTQTPGAFEYRGYHAGYFQEGAPVPNQEYQYGLGQMLNDTSTDMRNFAMGDGAVQYHQQGYCPQCEGQAFSQGGTNAWLGDTGAPLWTNDYYDTAFAYTYSTPAVQTTMIDIAFTTDQTWSDCGNASVDGTLPATPYSDLSTTCAQYSSMSSADGNWIDCYTQIGMCNYDNICGNIEDADQQAACKLCFPDIAKDANTVACLTAAGLTGQASMCSQ